MHLLRLLIRSTSTTPPLTQQDGALLNAHRIWLATGSVVDAASEPLLRSLLADLPVPLVAGLPAIQPSLEWARGAGLYVLGAYAALQVCMSRIHVYV